MLTQSDGESLSDPDDLIDTHISAGSVILQVATIGGTGSYTLTTILATANTPFQPIPVGSGSTSMVEGDFNSDGQQDLATLTYDTISILLGSGDGTFVSGPSLVVGPAAQAVVAGDFNGDGHVDLAVTNQDFGGTVSVFLGNGDGTFQPEKTFATGFDEASPLAGDFNGDGLSDLAVLDTDSDTGLVFLSNGDGTFRAGTMFATGFAPLQWWPEISMATASSMSRLLLRAWI